MKLMHFKAPQVTLGGSCSNIWNQCSTAQGLTCITSNNGANCPTNYGNSK